MYLSIDSPVSLWSGSPSSSSFSSSPIAEHRSELLHNSSPSTLAQHFDLGQVNTYEEDPMLQIRLTDCMKNLAVQSVAVNNDFENDFLDLTASTNETVDDDEYVQFVENLSSSNSEQFECIAVTSVATTNRRTRSQKNSTYIKEQDNDEPNNLPPIPVLKIKRKREPTFSSPGEMMPILKPKLNVNEKKAVVRQKTKQKKEIDYSQRRRRKVSKKYLHNELLDVEFDECLSLASKVLPVYDLEKLVSKSN